MILRFSFDKNPLNGIVCVHSYKARVHIVPRSSRPAMSYLRPDRFVKSGSESYASADEFEPNPDA